MERKGCDTMIPYKRAKKADVFNKLESQIVRDNATQQEPPTIKLECVTDDEQEYDIFATTNDSILTNLSMTCSDSEDPFEASVVGASVSQTNHTNDRPVPTKTPSGVGLQKASTTKEPTAATIMNMFRSLSKQIASIHNKIDHVHKEVANNTERLNRVEKKVGISLATIEKVQDAFVLLDNSSGNQLYQEMLDSKPASSFQFEKITNEKEFTAFDTKLGEDEEYYSYVKNGLRLAINTSESGNRMHEAIDMIFDRSFVPLCSWSGNGRPVAKIAFKTRTNILKLFTEIGSNTLMTVNELFVEQFFKNKLRHAKQRVNLQGVVKTTCHKRKIIRPSASPDEKHPKYSGTPVIRVPFNRVSDYPCISEMTVSEAI